jgi:hypothetical protein
MSDIVDPVRAAVLLRLEGRHATCQDNTETPVLSRINVRGLDRRFGELWQDGRVIGVGSAVEDGKVSLIPRYLSIVRGWPPGAYGRPLSRSHCLYRSSQKRFFKQSSH